MSLTTDPPLDDMPGEALKREGGGDAMQGVQHTVLALTHACAERAAQSKEFESTTKHTAETERVRHQRASAAAVQARTDGAAAAHAA